MSFKIDANRKYCKKNVDLPYKVKIVNVQNISCILNVKPKNTKYYERSYEILNFKFLMRILNYIFYNLLFIPVTSCYSTSDRRNEQNKEIKKLRKTK